jgi:enolase
VNQIGTLTETTAVNMAKNAGYINVTSFWRNRRQYNCGLSSCLNCGQIKTGSASRSDRMVHNQLRIEEEPDGLFSR